MEWCQFEANITLSSMGIFGKKMVGESNFNFYVKEEELLLKVEKEQFLKILPDLWRIPRTTCLRVPKLSQSLRKCKNGCNPRYWRWKSQNALGDRTKESWGFEVLWGTGLLQGKNLTGDLWVVCEMSRAAFLPFLVEKLEKGTRS